MTRRKMKKIFWILIACLLASNAVWAEEKNKESILGKAIDEVMSPLDKILTPPNRLEPIVVTPSRYEESSLDVSKNVTVIDKETIERSYVRSVPDLLKQQAGIVVRDLLGNGKTAQVDIRGFGDTALSNILVLVNGRRASEVDISGTDWTQIDVNSVDRIEIARGPGSVLYGDNAAGGVINIILKNGSGKKPAMGVKYRSGSYRYNSYSGYVEGGSDFLDYYGTISYSDTNGYRINNGLEAEDFNANVTFKPAPGSKIKVEGGYHKDWYGMPGVLRPQDVALLGWRGSTTPNDRAKTQDDYIMGSPETKLEMRWGDLALLCDILARSRRTASVFFYGGGINREINNHIRTLGLTPKAVFSSELFGMTNRVVAGFDGYNDRDEILNTNFGGGKDLIIITKKTAGFYAADTINVLPSLSLNSGYRAEWVWDDFNQQQMAAVRNGKSRFQYAVEAGVSYRYNERSAVYLNYARSFRFPVLDEFYDIFTGAVNSNLEPQFGNNYEIGVKENSSKYLSVKADYFIMDLKHEIYYDPISFSNSIYDHTMHRGLETEAHLFLFDCIDCFANYTYQQVYYIGSSYAGNDIPLVPQQKFAAGFTYTLMKCANFSYAANYVGFRRYLNDERSVAPRIKDHVTHDIKMSYYKYGFEAYSAIYNIFNLKYYDYGVSSADGRRQNYYPSPGINYVIGVNYKF